MSAFEDWFDKDFKSIHGDLADWRVIKGLMNIAFQAGRAYQREKDAVIAENTRLTYSERSRYREVCAKAIREQKITDD